MGSYYRFRELVGANDSQGGPGESGRVWRRKETVEIGRSI